MSYKTIEIPIWEKSNLTVEEAAAYTGIGAPKLRELSDVRRRKLPVRALERQQAFV